MQVINQKNQLETIISSHKASGKTIGFVPTMGALHSGHLSLVKNAFEHCEIVVVSIFVNPTQFDNPEDLEKYPRSLENDLQLLKECSPEIVVFTPSPTEVYNGTVFTKKFDFGPLEQYMEGKHRTGHFDGVGTVLSLLFSMVRPDKAFFGEKDFQQLLIVKKLIEITGEPLEIIACPIARESNGLAKSSRNERLTEIQRSEAAFIYKTLQKAKEDFGTKSANDISKWVHHQFDKNPYLKLEYFEIADAKTLKPVGEKNENTSCRAFIAAYAGEIRLIDNIALN